MMGKLECLFVRLSRGSGFTATSSLAEAKLLCVYPSNGGGSFGSFAIRVKFYPPPFHSELYRCNLGFPLRPVAKKAQRSVRRTEP